MEPKGVAALIITFGLVLILYSSLGLVGSLHFSIDPQVMGIVFFMGIVILLAMVLRKHTEM